MTDPMRSDGQWQSPRNYFTVAGALLPHSPSYSQLQPQTEHCPVSGHALQYPQSSSIPSSIKTDHPRPYYGCPATVGHGAYRILEQQQALVPQNAASTDPMRSLRQSPSEYYKVAGVPFQLSPSYSQLRPQTEHYPVSGHALQHSQSSSIPSSVTNDDPSTYYGHSATVGHDAWRISEQQQAQVPHSAASTSSKCLPTGELHVGIYKAKDIKGDEIFSWGKADPYAKVTFDTHEHNTPVDKSRVSGKAHFIFIDAGSNPEWNQLVRFIVKESDHKYNKLSITIRNKNFPFRKNNILGELIILNLGEIISNSNNNVFANWYPVFVKKKEKGKILLSFHFLPRSPADILKCPAVDVRVAREKPNPEVNYKWKVDANLIQIILQGLGIVVAVLAL